jgi:CheY-like chemotaxis protein
LLSKEGLKLHGREADVKTELLQGFRVLAVEPDRACAMVLERVLQRLQIDCRVASSMAEAWWELHFQPSCLLITELRLPDGDGLELAKSVRMSWPSTRIMVVTGDCMPQRREACRLEGVHEFLAKPYRLNDLAEAALRQSPVCFGEIAPTLSPAPRRAIDRFSTGGDSGV